MLFGQVSSQEKKRCVYMINKQRDSGALLTDMRKSAVWIDCWGMAVMHIFTLSMERVKFVDL